MHPYLRLTLLPLGCIALALLFLNVRIGNETRLKNASIEDLREISRRDPGNWRAEFYYAFRLATQENKFEDAYDRLSRIAREHPQEDVLYALAQAAVSTKRFREAVESLEKVLEMSPRRPEVHAQLASMLDDMGMFPDAARHLELVLAERPEQPQLWSQLGEALLRMREYERAEFRFRFLSEKRMSNIMGGGEAGLGYLALARGQYSEAETQLRSSLQAYRADPMAYRGLALLYLQGKATVTESALKEMDLAVTSFPEDPIVHAAKGEVYFRLGERAAATKILLKATSMKLAPSRAWERLTELHGSAGNKARADQAHTEFLKAKARESEEERLKSPVRKNPEDAKARQALGEFLAAQGDLPQAYVELTIARQKSAQGDSAAYEEVRSRLLKGEGRVRTFVP